MKKRLIVFFGVVILALAWIPARNITVERTPITFGVGNEKVEYTKSLNGKYHAKGFTYRYKKTFQQPGENGENLTLTVLTNKDDLTAEEAMHEVFLSIYPPLTWEDTMIVKWE